jgi:peptidoglycan/LPS O-acetylase OafA/YrhL
VLPPLEVRSVLLDGLFCAFYAGNFRFALSGTNYLADASPSPFQHFWSLGVEEQFYLVWPILLIGASLVWWRRRPSRPGAIAGLAAVAAASLYISVVWTRAEQPDAFFLLPARAWELAAGGLVALTVRPRRRHGSPAPERVRRALGSALAWGGLGAIVAACVLFGASTPFPGYAALLPVAGTAAVIAGGFTAGAAGPVLLLGRPLMRGVGRISYSWYLWHWPVLILVPIELHRTLTEADNLLLAAGSGALAIFTYRFIEEPARRSAWLSASPRRGLLAGAGLSAAAVVACTVGAVVVAPAQGHGRAPTAAIHTEAPPARKTADPAAEALSAFDAAQAQVVSAVAASASTADVPANLQPPLTAASSSEAPPMVDGCLLSYTSSQADEGCLFGDTTAVDSMVLFGDSHAAMWFPAVDAWANAHSYRLYVFTKAACPPVDITLFSPVLDRTWTECRQWYTNVMAALSTIKPAVAVVGIAPNYTASYDVVQDGSAWLSGLQATIASMRAESTRVLVLGSVPSPPQDIPDCLSAAITDVGRCDFPAAGRRVGGGGLWGVDFAGQAAEAQAVTASGARYIDTVPWFCTASVCDTVVDNLLVYRDNSHITVPYAEYLTPLIDDAITATVTP